MRIGAWAFTLAVACTSGAAFADGPSEVEIKNAQSRFDEGRGLGGKGQYEEARVKFVQAWAVLKSPDVLYSLALAEKKSAHPIEALRHFRQLVKDSTTPKDLLDRSAKYIDELSATTGHVIVHAPGGSDVSVDGVVIGRAPIDGPIDTLPGRVAIAIALEGRTAQQGVTLAAGQSSEVALSFPAEGEQGRPSRRTEVPNPRPPEIGREHSTGEYVLVGGLAVAGVASLVASGLFASSSSSSRDSAAADASNHACDDRGSAACAHFRSENDDAAHARTLTLATEIAGGALLAGAAVTGVIFFALPKSTSPQGLWVAPSVRPHSASVEAGLRF